MRMKLGAKKKTHSRNAMHVESQFQLKRRRKFPPSDTSHTTTNRGRPRVAKRDVPIPRGSSINCAQFNVCYVSSITHAHKDTAEGRLRELGRDGERETRSVLHSFSFASPPLESASLFNNITTCAVSLA